MKTAIGKAINASRLNNGFTQEYMACKLGLTVTSFANIEHGRVDISSTKISKISTLLGIKPHQLVALAEKIINTENDI